MKNIISTLGKQIQFNLSGTRKLLIDPVKLTEVSDEEYNILNKRLGSQIREVYASSNTSANASASTEQATAEDVEQKTESSENETVSAEDENKV